MLSLYDLLRLIGIFAGIGYSFHAGHISEVPTWTAALVAGVVGVGVSLDRNGRYQTTRSGKQRGAIVVCIRRDCWNC